MFSMDFILNFILKKWLLPFALLYHLQYPFPSIHQAPEKPIHTFHVPVKLIHKQIKYIKHSWKISILKIFPLETGISTIFEIFPCLFKITGFWVFPARYPFSFLILVKAKSCFPHGFFKCLRVIVLYSVLDVEG